MDTVSTPVTIETYTAMIQDCLTTVAESFNQHQAAIDNLSRAEQLLHHAEIALSRKETEILLEYSDLNLHPNGFKELGANDEARKAMLSFLTAPQRASVQSAELAVIKTKGEREITSQNKQFCVLAFDHLKELSPRH